MSAPSFMKQSSKTFLDLITKRRSIYQLSDKPILTPTEVSQVVKAAVREAPSPFNMQSSRVIILFGEQHKNYWGKIVPDALFKSGGEKAVSASKPKLDMFKAASGSVVFMEDTSVVKKMQEQFPRYAPSFPIWSYHSSGMAQIYTWTLLEAEGYGCSLQHYGNITSDALRQTYNLPDSYEIQAEMVFGTPLQGAGEKTFMDDDERVKSYGA